MDVRTYRARTLQDALALVRRELGPRAAVLHTREVRSGGVLGWMGGAKLIEVAASSSVVVPSRLKKESAEQMAAPEIVAAQSAPGADFRARARAGLKGQADHAESIVEDLCRRGGKNGRHDLGESLFRLFTDLIESELTEELARELVDRVREEAPRAELDDPMLAKARVVRMIEEELPIGGPIQTTPNQRRLVALVGPTGVGKTTTIAKLAANYRLKEKKRVGLITVDTYRIAAVEQLRTYADIIDLPMEVVSTPREMRQAVARLAEQDLVLMDTAGRSPGDEVKIQELKSMLAEAEPDEVHLVLSSVASAATLTKTAERFAEVGTTALLLTKLDEASGLGNLVPLFRGRRLPLSYLTNGQRVPDDIAPAERVRLARMILGMETGG